MRMLTCHSTIALPTPSDLGRQGLYFTSGWPRYLSLHDWVVWRPPFTLSLLRLLYPLDEPMAAGYYTPVVVAFFRLAISR